MLNLKHVIDKNDYKVVVKVTGLNKIEHEFIFVKEAFFNFNDLRNKISEKSLFNLKNYFKKNKEIIFKKN